MRPSSGAESAGASAHGGPGRTAGSGGARDRAGAGGQSAGRKGCGHRRRGPRRAARFRGGRAARRGRARRAVRAGACCRQAAGAGRGGARVARTLRRERRAAHRRAGARALAAQPAPMLNAAGSAPRGEGFLDRVQQNAERLVRIRPISEAPGDDAATIVARADVKAAHGDLARRGVRACELCRPPCARPREGMDQTGARRRSRRSRRRASSPTTRSARSARRRHERQARMIRVRRLPRRGGTARARRRVARRPARADRRSPGSAIAPTPP